VKPWHIFVARLVLQCQLQAHLLGGGTLALCQGLHAPKGPCATAVIAAADDGSTDQSDFCHFGGWIIVTTLTQLKDLENVVGGSLKNNFTHYARENLGLKLVAGLQVN